MYILSFPNLIDNRFDLSYGSQSCGVDSLNDLGHACMHAWSLGVYISDTLIGSIDGKPNFGSKIPPQICENNVNVCGFRRGEILGPNDARRNCRRNFGWKKELSRSMIEYVS